MYIPVISRMKPDMHLVTGCSWLDPAAHCACLSWQAQSRSRSLVVAWDWDISSQSQDKVDKMRPA